MSDIIQEERETVLREANTAQVQLENIIQSLKPDIVDLNLQQELSGDLDLTVLESKFPRLRTLLFGPGKITHLRNVPPTVSKLTCSRNLLTNLEGLPGSLLYLDIDRNYLTSLDLSKTPYLEELHCANNRLENLTKLPENLTKLYCNENKLQRLDFSGLPHLKVVNVSNNPLLVVNNLPENIHEYVAENNPLTMETNIYDYEEWEYEDTLRQGRDIAEKKHVQQRKIKYVDALNVYFKYKSQYEADLLKRRREAFKKAGGKRAAMVRAQRIQGRCLKCKRTVGMSFFTNTEGYFARCGDDSHPCEFNIKLFRGNFSYNDYFLYLFKEQLETEKTAIIRKKLDSLFNYVSEETSVKEFKKILDTYNDTSALYGELLKRNDEIYHDKHKQELIAKKQEKIYTLLARIKSMLQEYKTSERSQEHQHATYGGVTGILRTTMEIYVNDLLPEMENLRRLKYEIMEMENNTLFQRAAGLTQLEYTYGDAPSVERFRGV